MPAAPKVDGKRFRFRPKRCYDGGPIGFLNNDERAESAGVALDAFLLHVGESDPDKEANATDLISNLGHWCDREKVDFNKVLRMVQAHWSSER